MKRVGIIGYGRFGRALAEVVQQSGHELLIFDTDGAVASAIPNGIRAASLAVLSAGVDAVVVATPVSTMPAVFRELRSTFGALPGKAPLVMDVGSVKVAPVMALESVFGAGARVVGTHPLFGPTSLAHASASHERGGLTVVVCEASSYAAAREAEVFWRELGCETQSVSAEEHDRVMARTHALTFFIAKGLLDAGLDDLPPFAPPSYRAMVRAIEAVRTDAGHLLHSIEVDNPFAANARASLLRALTTAHTTLSLAATPTSALTDTRSLIDELDRDLVSLLERRATLAERAARAKDTLGIGTRDLPREAELLEKRRAWARDAHLDPDAVADVFEAILTFSRAHQGAVPSRRD